MTPNQTYDEALAKGQKLLAVTLANDPKTSCIPPGPTFPSQTALQTWGYKRTITAPASPYTTLHDDLRALGVACHGKGIHISDVHSYDTTNVPRTGAVFESILERENGLLIASGNYTPAWCVANSSQPDQALPDLCHWSDLAYLQWTDSGDRPSDLKVVVRSAIENTVTNKVVEHILDALNEKSGRSFTWDMDSEEAVALLGTPNGAGVAWMVSQCRTELGWKVVERVTLFWEGGKDGAVETRGWPSLVFWLGNGGGEEVS